MIQSKVEGTGHTPIGPSISDVDNENINNPSASLSNPSHLSDMGSKSLEEQLDSLLSIPSLNEFLKIAGENHHSNKDDNDNIEDELSRLRALELDLSQELNRFELHEEDVMNESRFDVSYDGTFDDELVYDDGSIVSSIDMEESFNDNHYDEQYYVDTKPLHDHATCCGSIASSLTADITEYSDEDVSEKSLKRFISRQRKLRSKIQELYECEESTIIMNHSNNDDARSLLPDIDKMAFQISHSESDERKDDVKSYRDRAIAIVTYLRLRENKEREEDGDYLIMMNEVMDFMVNVMLGKDECQYNDETIIGDYLLSGSNDLYGMLSQTWKSTSKMFLSPLVVVAFLMKVLHSSRMASYALK